MIPFVDLKIQFQALRSEMLPSMEKVASEANFILGEQVSQFESSFASFCGAGYSVGVASGTDALHLALRALDIGPRDEVITVANTFVATVLGISYTGATPVLVDIDPKTYNLDLNAVEDKITKKTKAILPVHLYGRMVDMPALMSLARKYGLKVVEDACQAHGAEYQGRKAGTFGAMGCFSFYPGKNLGAYGDGGAIVTSDPDLNDKLRMLRNYGSPKKYFHDFIGFNSRLDTLQAAVLSVKLKHLSDWNDKRYKNALNYNKKLAGVGDLVLPDTSVAGAHIFHLYVIRTKKRDELLKHLATAGIQCGIHYPVPVYALKAYASLGLKAAQFPVTDSFSREILSLPMFPELTEAQIDEVARSIKTFFGG